MTRRVFLHIGLHKTGTSYLQGKLRSNVGALARHGIEYPSRSGLPSVFSAVDDLQGRRPRGARDERVTGSWDVVVDHINSCDAVTAVLSDERLSLSSVRAIKRVARSFGGSELHVVVTVRDLARVLVSSWQEDVKTEGTWTWQQFVDDVKNPAKRAVKPARTFWVRQDVVQICAAWELAVPAERLHVVTVPPVGNDRHLLLERLASVIGFDAGLLAADPRWTNDQVGVTGTELLRRLNTELTGTLNQRQYDRAVKLSLARFLATDPASAGAPVAVLPPEETGWVADNARETIQALTAGGYPVVGDLRDLLPAPGRRQGQGHGVRPDAVDERALLDAAVRGLGYQTKAYARTWWGARPPDAPVTGVRPTAASRFRAGIFEVQRRVLRVLDGRAGQSSAATRVFRLRERTRVRAGRTASRLRRH